MPKRPTIAERTLSAQSERIGKDIAELQRQIDRTTDIMSELRRQQSSIDAEIHRLYLERNAKP